MRVGYYTVWIAVVLAAGADLAFPAEETRLPVLSSDYPSGLDKDGIYKYANDFYLDNKPEKALEGYNYLYALGVRNGYLFYNLGNTYFRLGQLGKSMVWYERALRYLPRFHDLRVNYDYARNLLPDEEFRSPEYGGTLGFLTGIHEKVNLRECLWISLILMWLLSSLFIVRIFLPAQWRGAWLSVPCWIVGIAFILFCLSSTVKIIHYESVSEAVVMASAVEIKTGPGNDYSTSFSLHEGTKVQLVQEQGDWVRIVLPGNTSFTGWMPRSSTEVI